MKKLIGLLVLLALMGGAVYGYFHTQSGTKTSYKFEEIARGRLQATISATGTLQPRETVDVGAQVAGPIIFIGKDLNTKSGIVDWGSRVKGPVPLLGKQTNFWVELDAWGFSMDGMGMGMDTEGNLFKKGTVLAQIDDALYRATYNSAQASVRSARADLLQKTAIMEQATADWKRAQKLLPIGGIQQQEYDQYKANFDTSTANVGVSKAQIGVAEANMRLAKTNLDYSTITSPVDGVVIDRRVNIGQTVVASLSAPSLFLLAKDLSQMEVWATVNEVDVGKIEKYQKVKFTVDAFPGKAYFGEVVPQGDLPFRLNATMNQNVVTYTVVVSVDNRDLKLSPYMTANLSFIIADKADALMVPNAALRWTPSAKQIAPDQRDAYNKMKSKKRTPTDIEGQDRGLVWTQEPAGFVRFHEVRTGASDTVHTDILGFINGDDLPEHTPLIVGEGKADVGEPGGANPFVPQMFKSKPKE
jgi:HlyD family secretion protein